LTASHHAQSAAVCDTIFSHKNDAASFRTNAVLFFPRSAGERPLLNVMYHRTDGLHDAEAVVEIFVHEMHGTPGEFHAVFERLALRLETRKRRQQRRMNVENAIGKLGDEIRREQAHVASKTN